MNQNRTATIRDVAKRAGVSESTVSRVLSGVETQIAISEETRVAVQRAARDLGYRPHPGARALSGKNSFLLGLIVREISDPWFAQMIEILNDLAKERGYGLVLGNARRDPREALALRDMMLDLRYCVALFLCGDLQESPEDQGFLNRMGETHRLVSIARGNAGLGGNTPSVGVDNRQGALLALMHLAELGHRRIGCISAGRVGDLHERVGFYREFMVERFGSMPDAYLELDCNSYEGGYEAARRLLALALPVRPTAIFAADDRLAIGAIAAATDMGLRIPADVSFVGFDDMEGAAFCRPALTTVRQPMEAIGRKAFEVILAMIEDESKMEDGSRYQFTPELVVRASCAAVRDPVAV
jgi:DNA-binding LacI/PurR family transcriptional regulator